MRVVGAAELVRVHAKVAELDRKSLGRGPEARLKMDAEE